MKLLLNTSAYIFLMKCIFLMIHSQSCYDYVSENSMGERNQANGRIREVGKVLLVLWSGRS